MNKFIEIMLCITSCMISIAQLKSQVNTSITSKNEVNSKFFINDTTTIPFVDFRGLTLEELDSLRILDSIQSTQLGYYQFAVLYGTEIDMVQAGHWVSNQYFNIGIIGIYAENAQSLSLVFKDLYLPVDGELYLIPNDKTFIHGPITRDNITQIEDLSSEVFATDSLLIIYIEPLAVNDSMNINIIEIGYGYREGESLSCQIDITEDAGDCFQLERRGVCKLLFNRSTAFCTGTLINNTDYDNDLKPYILTANHCFANPPVIPVHNIVARFRDWKGNNKSGWISYMGAQKIANTESSDAYLLELNNKTLPNELFHLGWSISNMPPATSTFLHHPNGDVMKISYDHGIAITNQDEINFTNFSIPVEYSWIVDLSQEGDFGISEFGTSGSSLLNPNHKIVGQAAGIFLHGCSSQTKRSIFGRFDKSWSEGNSVEERLKDWLDPNNIGVGAINSTFSLVGSNVIPCANLIQDIYAPTLKTNSGNLYTYNWESSSTITLIGSGPNIRFKDSGGCAGCPGWISCSISTPSSCGGDVIASSVTKKITWTNVSPATDFKHGVYPPTNNNGSFIGPFNNICAYGLYFISAGFKGIPVPKNTVFVWSHAGNIITPYHSADGWQFAFQTNSPGMFTLTVKIVAGTGCLVGKTETYVFQVLHPCSSGEPQPIVSSTNEGYDFPFTIFPNPTNGIFRITVGENIDFGRAEIKVYNSVGNDILNMMFDDYISYVDMSMFPSGVYFATIRMRNKIYTEKILVYK